MMSKRTWGYKILAYKLRINPVVQEDLKDIKEYIEKDDPNAAIKVINELLEKMQLLKQFPELGQMLMYKIKINTKYRYIIVGSYLIFYLFEDNIISVQRVLHGSRDYISLFNEYSPKN